MSIKEKYKNTKNMGMENLNLKMEVNMKVIFLKEKSKGMEYITLMVFHQQQEFGIKENIWAKTIH